MRENISAPGERQASGRRMFGSPCPRSQHGQNDYASKCAMLTGVSTTAPVPLVRVHGNDPGEVMRALDAGAYGVICPTIN